LVGWLSGFRAQTGSVAYWSYAMLVRRLGEAAAPWGRGVRAVPRLCIEYPGIRLTTEENHGKPVRVTEWRSDVQRRTRFVLSTWSSRAMASTGLLSAAALGFRVRRRGQPSAPLSWVTLLVFL